MKDKDIKCPKCGSTLIIDDNQDRHLKCPKCGYTVEIPKSIWERIRPWIVAVGLPFLCKFLGDLALTALHALLSQDSDSSDDTDEVKFISDSEDIEDTTCIEPSQPKTGRYIVECKAFKTGEWFQKTDTDYKRSAISVAHNHTYGRAYRVTDTETGKIIEEHDEEQDMKDYALNWKP